MKPLLLRLLSISLALALSGGAMASDPAPASERELAQAREELRRAAARMAELSGHPRQPTHAADEARQHARSRALIGVLLDGDGQPGVRISGVTPDGAAARAGLRSGDRLLSVDGVQILGASGALRLENARRLLGKLEADKARPLGYRRDGRDASVLVAPERRRSAVAITTGDGGRFEWIDEAQIQRSVQSAMRGVDSALLALDTVPGITPEVRREITRISRDGACGGADCGASRLLSAFRWHGLNLASVDRQLGRYFGTDRGVLVLTTGELDGLQAGDVIQRVDGEPVATPRELMSLLQAKGEGSRATVDYLRDRKAAQARIAMPRMPTMPSPPAPPAPPAPPKTSRPPPPAAPAPPPAPPAVATIAASPGNASSQA